MEDVAENVPDDRDPDERFELDQNEGNDVDRRDEESRGQVDEESGVDGVSDLDDTLTNRLQDDSFSKARPFYGQKTLFPSI